MLSSGQQQLQPEKEAIVEAGLSSSPWVAGFSAQTPYAKFYLPTVADFSNVDTNVISR